MIRPFTSADLDAAAKIWLQGNLDAHPFIPAAYWERNFAAVREALPQANVLVDAENGQIRGFLGLIGDEIAGIFVERRFRSGGVGKRLLDAAKQRHSRLTLHVYRANTRACVLPAGGLCDTGGADGRKHWRPRIHHAVEKIKGPPFSGGL